MSLKVQLLIASLGVLIIIGVAATLFFALLHSAVPPTSSFVVADLPPGADPATYAFVCSNNLECLYAKDKNHVYFRGSILVGADPATFVVIDSYYARDKNHVYYENPLTGAPPVVVQGDSATFKTLGGNGLYTLDATHVYWNNTIILNANPATFTDVYSGSSPTAYATDDTTVYHDGTPISSDPQNFTIISVAPSSSGGDDGYAADSTTVYYDGAPIPGADPTTFIPPPLPGTGGGTTGGGGSSGGSTGSGTGDTSSNTSGSDTSGSSQTQNTNSGGTGSGSTNTGGGGGTSNSTDIGTYFLPNAVVKDPNGF